MEYNGKLYGRLARDFYFDTGKTSEDYDNLVKRVAELEALLEQKLNIHGVMQGCQCKDRIGETTVWCCNQCGLPCEEGWLPTHKAIRQPAVASSAVGKGVSVGCLYTPAHKIECDKTGLEERVNKPK